EDHLGAERLEQPAALKAHAFGHGHLELIATSRANIRQSNARVAAGRLDDHRVLVDSAVLLGGIDHGPADAVLDAPQRIEAFALGHHRGAAALGDTTQSDQGSVADATRDIVVNSLFNLVDSLNRGGHVGSS